MGSGMPWYAEVQHHRDLASLSLIGWKSTDIGKYGKYLRQVLASPRMTNLDPWVTWPVGFPQINLFQPMGYPDSCSALNLAEPNPGLVWKFRSVAELDQWSSLEFREWQYFAELVWTHLNWTLLRCQNICLPFLSKIACDQFLIHVSDLNAAILEHITYSQLTSSDIVSASIIKVVGALTNNFTNLIWPRNLFWTCPEFNILMLLLNNR